MTRCSWSVLQSQGEVPTPRSYHASCSVGNAVFVHGGECDHQLPSLMLSASCDTQQTSIAGAEDMNTLGSESDDYLLPYNSQILNDTSTKSKLQKGPMKGVCPGDSIVTSKAFSKVFTHISFSSAVFSTNSLLPNGR